LCLSLVGCEGLFITILCWYGDNTSCSGWRGWRHRDEPTSASPGSPARLKVYVLPEVCASFTKN
jgi:hypothetical protein